MSNHSENAGDTLARLSDDATKWAAEFRATAISLGYSDMDEGWLIGWFANAIEHSGDVRRWKKEQEIAAHLAAQAEWPSDAVDRVWAKLVSPATPSAVKRTSITKEDIRAALQSLRPPVEMVSDEDIERACEADFGKDAWHALSYEQKSEMRRRQRAALESYASRHAPTKD